MNTTVKLLLIFVNEADQFHNRPLYQAIVERLHQLDVAGATAQTGIMGFGSHQKVHHKRLFGISDDKPVVITAVDNEAKLRKIVPEIRSMVREGLIVLVDAEFIA